MNRVVTHRAEIHETDTNAVAELGIDHLDMPLTPERLWHALRDAAGGKAA